MSGGFFSEAELGQYAPPPREHPERKNANCRKCGLRESCSSPVLPPLARGKTCDVLLVSPAPTNKEDAAGRYLRGSIDKIILEALSAAGVPSSRVVKTSALRCRPPKGATPSAHVEHCRPYLVEAAEQHRPRIILPIGGDSVAAVLGRSLGGAAGGAAIWEGYKIPDRKWGCWVCPMTHPAAFMDGERDDALRQKFWSRALTTSIKAAMAKPFPEHIDEAAAAEVLDDDGAKKYMRGLLKRSEAGRIVVGYDYEATGIKPYAKGHRLVSVGFSERYGHGVAFIVNGKTRPLLRKIVRSTQIKKVVANMSYELAWTMEHLGCRLRSVIWDTVLSAHVLDNSRKGTTGVKFNAYRRLGVADYGSEMKAYFKEDGGKDDNAINRILEAPRNRLLRYCAMDAMLEYEIAQQQREEMGLPLWE